MIQIPTQTKQFSITNNSDQTGNIWYTKNVIFDEKGYIKLSPRTVGIISDSTSDSPSSTDFGLVASFGRYQTSTQYLLGTITNPFTTSISTTSFTAAIDAGAGVPVTSVETRATFWQGRWYMSTPTKLYWKNLTSGAWTDTGITLTTGIRHPVCQFRNLNSLCVGNGNTVQLIDTAHALTRTLTLPADYEVTAISYSNSKVCIVTRLSLASIHTSQEAYIFIWDGGTVAANAGFGVGTDEVLEVVAYKSSFVLTARTGELKYFNGGGFDTLAQFPFFINRRTWTLGDMIGDTMIVEGDKIYINITGQLSALDKKQQSFLQNYNGGIWCYDPQVGLYNTYSPSISVASLITVTNANVNTSTDTLTSTAGSVPTSGSPIKVTSGSIGGLTTGYVYYVIRISPTTFRLALTPTDALNNTAIDLTSTGDANNYFLGVNLLDYGQSLMTFTGGIVINDSRGLTYDKMLMSTRCYNVSASQVNYAQIVVADFDNVGYYVTPRLISQGVEDVFQKVFVKYFPLKSNDTITIRCKYENIYGLPASTPQAGATCTWVTAIQFTTTADFSEAYTYLATSGNECECEITSGAGAGQMSKISSMTLNAGTYTVNLSDTMEGVLAGNISNVIIDNWKTLGTVTSTDLLGYKEFPIGISSKWIKVKTIMKGTDITIEELEVINKVQKPSI